MRTVIYARYSTDLQNPKSIDDQIRVCREFASRAGLTVTHVQHDAAASGMTMLGRPGLQNVLNLCLTREVDVVLCEDQDRLSRDMADVMTFAKHLSFAGARIFTVAGGELDTLRLGISGIVAQMEVEKIREKVRRGLTGVHEDGRSAGGISFGYRPKAGEVRGVLEIVPEQAQIVRRVFEQYAAGMSAKGIAAGLNADQISPPRKDKWAASGIYGSAKQHTGMLRNALYDGRMVWNKRNFVRDPNTGKRVARINPPDVWREREVDHLRIVSSDLWSAVQDRLGSTTRHWTGRSFRIFSGLIKCGACNAGMAIASGDRKGKKVRCSAYSNSGTCNHSRLYYIDDIEQSALSGLTDEICSPAFESALRDEYHAAYREEQAQIMAEAGGPTVDVDALKAKRQRVVDMMIDGVLARADGNGRLRALDREISTARAANQSVVPMVPNAKIFAAFRTAIANVSGHLNQLDIQTDAAAKAIRNSVEAITIAPTPAGQAPIITVQGTLSDGVVGTVGCGGRI
ncbi:MAG: recombinase family protein [Pseudomonadota bacterium]